VGEAQGSAKGARITGAIALTEAEVLEHLRTGSSGARPCAGWLMNAGSRLCWTPPWRDSFARGSDPKPDPAAMTAFLCDRIRAEGLGILPLGKASLNLLKRARFAGSKPWARKPCWPSLRIGRAAS
jgi:ATP-dependent helicase HrpB